MVADVFHFVIEEVTLQLNETECDLFEIDEDVKEKKLRKMKKGEDGVDG